jgi:photosystem II stability/assembly factor-like uncharacterized protein
MTTDNELEQRLRAFYRAEAGDRPVAPQALQRDVAAIPRTYPRRAGWLGGRRGFTLLAAAAVLLVGGAAAAGSGLLRLQATVPVQPAPSLAADVPTTPPLAPTARPTDAPTPAPTEKGLPAVAGQFAQPCDFGLAPGGVGWVTTPAAIYRTENLGRTWSIVSPPGYSDAPTGRDIAPVVTSFFADANTAYTYLPGAPGTIAVTHDGGANWTEQTIAGTVANEGASFWFQTPATGSLIFFPFASKDNPSRMFTTADGGATWTGPRPGPSDHNAGQAVWGGCNHAALQSAVVRTVRPPGDFSMANMLQVSHDAGATWVNRTLPVGPQAPASGPSHLVDKTVIAAWGDGSGLIVVALGVDGAPGVFHDQIYTSTDDGRSWQYVATQDPLHIGQNSQFLSATEWILVADDASTFMSTTDGGATWRTVTGAVRFYVNFNPNNVSFASPDVGWLRPSCNDPMTPEPRASVCTKNDTSNMVLLQTTDGGATWTPLDKQP